MDYKDYYKILGVEKTANEADIKRAYRKLARKYHPDVSKEKNAEERFKEIGEAYEVLKDPEKRAAYDQLGANYKAGQDFKPPPGWDAGFEFSGGDFSDRDTSGFSDFFSSLFGQQDFGRTQGRRSDYSARGEDHHAKIVIDLEDAYKGAARSITLRAAELDTQGQVITKNRMLNVKIPKGVKQGQKIRLSGQGSAGMGNAAAGDLYLEIEFNPHSIYSVEAHDVYLNLPLTPWEAALGATVKVPTPDGIVDLKIPENTRSGQKLRLRGRGIPAKQAGDLYVVAQITLPAAETEAAKALYREMKQKMPYNPRQKLGV